MEPLSEFKDDILTLRGVHNKVGGDGDDHMKGIGCLLTGRRLHRGNIQGGAILLQDGRAAYPLIKKFLIFFSLKIQQRRDLAHLNLVLLFRIGPIHGLAFHIQVLINQLLRSTTLNRCCKKCMGK